MIRRIQLFVRVLLPLTLWNCSCASRVNAGEFAPGRQVGIVKSELVSETSGMVASRQNPGVLWVHNDSGDAARVYALNTKAEFLGICNIAGASARDWEDIAVGPGPDPNRQYLYLGDIGDNRDSRSEVIVYRVPEPKVNAAGPFAPLTAGPAEALRLAYPDGPRDAETLLVDPLTRDIYIISKRELFSKVYLAAAPQSTTQRTAMKRVAVLPWGFATGGDVSPDGRRVIVRGMFSAGLWDRPAGEGTPTAEHRVADPVPLWRAFAGKQVPLALLHESQGEAICFDAAGAGYFTISEGRHPPLHYFGPAPAEGQPHPASVP